MCYPSRRRDDDRTAPGAFRDRGQLTYQRTQLRRPDDRTHARGAPQEAGLHHRSYWQVASRLHQGTYALRRGFDEFYGIHHGGHSFLPTSKQRTKGRLMRGDQEITEETYLTTALGREAVNFVDRHHRTPFFLCLSFTAVHKPLEATEADLKRFPDMKPGKRKTHAAMTVSMDDAVGKLLASLHAHDLEKNTLIIFISDNGGFRAIASRNTLLVPSGTSSRAAIASPSPCNGPDAFLPARSTRSRSAPWISCPPPSYAGRHHRPPMEARRRQPHALPQWHRQGAPARDPVLASERKAIRHGNWKMIHDAP